MQIRNRLQLIIAIAVYGAISIGVFPDTIANTNQITECTTKYPKLQDATVINALKGSLKFKHPCLRTKETYLTLASYVTPEELKDNHLPDHI